MGRLLAWVGQATRWPYAFEFDRWRERPREAQERLLLDIVRANATTEYGREMGFSEINSIEDYQDRVPVVTYDDMQERVERMTRGERKVLTAEAPHYYCCTSGTTGTPKYNAITNAYRRQWQRATQVFIYHFIQDHPQAALQKVLYFVGSTRLGTTPDGTPYGTMSGYNYNAMPSVAKKMYAVPYDVFQIQELDLKYYTIARLALTSRLSLGVAITPTPLITLARTVQNNIEQLIRDVADGGMEQASQLPAQVRAILEPTMVADKARARQLEEMATRPFTATDVWPDLSLLTCWIGAAAGLYVPELKECYPGVPLRDAIYSATEAWCTIPMEDERPGGPLAVLSHFFEFIPEDEYDSPSRRVLTADLLEEGKRYFILMTTGGGVYRYDIKDVLQVDGYYGRIPKLRFVYKGNHCSNLSGEKMTEGHFNETIVQFKEKRGADVTYFCAVPREEAGNQGYTLYLECPEPVEGAEDILEDILRKVNWEYESHRSCGDLAPLEVVPLEPGNYQRIRQHLTESGANEAQMKPPHLTRKASFIDMLEPLVQRKEGASS